MLPALKLTPVDKSPPIDPAPLAAPVNSPVPPARISKVAAVATETSPVPGKAAALLNVSVPAAIVVPPTYVFAAVRVSMPAPLLTSAPGPPNEPEYVVLRPLLPTFRVTAAAVASWRRIPPGPVSPPSMKGPGPAVKASPPVTLSVTALFCIAPVLPSVTMPVLMVVPPV